LPPRDYEIAYSEEKITGMFKSGAITKKGDSELIEKWLKKGAPHGKLKVAMGDSECNFCEYKKQCWEGVIPLGKRSFSNLPSSTEKKQPPKTNSYFL